MDDKHIDMVERIFADINKKLKSEKWSCLHEDCRELAINSHFLQKNGILSKLTKDGFIREVNLVDPNHWKREGAPISFTKVSINNALSLRLFCQKHDNILFKSIEKGNNDLKNYDAFLLFSYRVTCAELRKKKFNSDVYAAILNNDRLAHKINMDYIEQLMVGFLLGCRDLYKLKMIFEREIKKQERKFTYKVFEYDLIEICASAIFSPPDSNPIDDEEHEELENVYIHLIPKDDKLLLLVGHHNDYLTPWITDYMNSWKNLDEVKFERKISELFVKQIENWAISEQLYTKLKPENIKDYIKYSTTDSDKMSLNYNLFE